MKEKVSGTKRNKWYQSRLMRMGPMQQRKNGHPQLKSWSKRWQAKCGVQLETSSCSTNDSQQTGQLSKTEVDDYFEVIQGNHQKWKRSWKRWVQITRASVVSVFISQSPSQCSGSGSLVTLTSKISTVPSLLTLSSPPYHHHHCHLC